MQHLPSAAWSQSCHSRSGVKQDANAQQARDAREDKIRTTDREWGLRDRNWDKRRAAYQDLLAAADAFAQGAGILSILKLGISDPQFEGYADTLVVDITDGHLPDDPVPVLWMPLGPCESVMD